MENYNEQWKPVLEGTYSVSSLGRIRSEDRLITNGNLIGNPVFTRKGRLREPRDNGNGYLYLRCSINGKYINKYIHRLVAEAFIPNLENKPEVNHINGIKNDNRLINLEWCTRSENSIHAQNTGLKKILRGEATRNTKLTTEEVIKIRGESKHNTFIALGAKYGVSRRTIADVVNRKSWTHI